MSRVNLKAGYRIRLEIPLSIWGHLGVRHSPNCGICRSSDDSDGSCICFNYFAELMEQVMLHYKSSGGFLNPLMVWAASLVGHTLIPPCPRKSWGTKEPVVSLHHKK
jgi:hypothetical protein